MPAIRFVTFAAADYAAKGRSDRAGAGFDSLLAVGLSNVKDSVLPFGRLPSLRFGCSTLDDKYRPRPWLRPPQSATAT